MDQSQKQALFQVIQGGPMEVTGNFTIKGHNGKIYEAKSPAYLCRCGSSGNKPFCDGSHRKTGFNG